MLLIKESGSLGELLRTARDAQHITQEGAAEKAGVARSTLNRWERGTHQPRLPELMAILDVLNATALLRKQALTSISAPRAAHYLREQTEANVPEGEEWVFLPESGDLLRAMRMRRHQTQEQIAAQLGIQRNTLSRWEGGELLPSRERLNSLLTLLDAYPEERVALTRSKRSPFLTPNTTATSLEELAFRLGQIAEGSYDASVEPLKDLEYLRLEIALAQSAPRHRAARHLLLHTYCWHTQWLVGNQRYKEAEKYAERVMEAVYREAVPDPQWQRAGLAAARCAVYGGKQPHPARGIEVLEHWLPLTDSPEFEAWVLGDMALYLAMEGRLEAALDLAMRACRVARHCENPVELRLRRVDRVEILLTTGLQQNANYALELLPTDYADHPGERAREAVLWSESLLIVGETSEAHDWLGRASALVQEYHLDAAAVDALAKRF